MIISIREAYLGKRDKNFPSKNLDGWMLGKKSGVDGWDEEFMRERGLKDNHSPVSVYAVDIDRLPDYIYVHQLGHAISGTDFNMDYWFKETPYGLLLFEVEPSKNQYVDKIKEALNDWDGSTKKKIML